jgi:hypothetical protein
MNESDSDTARLDPPRTLLHPRFAEPPVTAVPPVVGKVFIAETSKGIPPEKYPV